jgi:hypothetical protein
VHFEHAGAGDEGQGFAVFGVVELLVLVAIGGDTAAGPASTAATARPAAPTTIVTRLPAAVSTAAAFLLGHVIQHLKKTLLE